MRALTRALLVLVPVAVLWGCTTTPTTTGDDAALGADSGAETMDGDVETGAIGAGIEDSGVEVGGVGGMTEFEGDPLQDPDSLLSKRTIYFDFDKSDIGMDAREIIEAHARYLSDNPSARILLEGHADERGTREYNLGLGERRAKAVQQIMTLLGASSAQIEMVSYGEERPAVMGHDEEAWALNRRVEIVY